MRRDIDFSFKAHPLTGDLAVKTGSSAIRQSIINIVRTNFYDRGFNINLATNLDAQMFENFTPVMGQAIKTNITNALRNFEPQIEVFDVSIEQSRNNEHELIVTIYYTELNSPQEHSVMIELSRVR